MAFTGFNKGLVRSTHAGNEDGRTVDFTRVGVDDRHGWAAEVDEQLLANLVGVALLAFPRPVVIAKPSITKGEGPLLSLILLLQQLFSRQVNVDSDLIR